MSSEVGLILVGAVSNWVDAPGLVATLSLLPLAVPSRERRSEFCTRSFA